VKDSLVSACNSIELTILMPCLNEAETLATCINKAKAFLQRENISGEIVIADNGSLDGSQEIATQHGARIVHVPIRGYGSALQHGIQGAAGQYIIMGDADDSYDFLSLKPFIAKLREGYDLVMGNRFKGSIKPGAMPFLNKYLGNPVLSLLGRLFFKSSLGDFHCGLRGFRRDAIQQLNLQSTGMEFASEMIVQATLQELKITEVPTTLSPDGRSRRPHLRPWRDGWRHLKLLLLMCPRWLFLYPGFALVLLGMTGMTLLSTGPLQWGHYSFDVHTMLFASMSIIIGLQGVFFFLCAKLISKKASPSVERWMKIFTIEKGLLLGGTVCSVGLGGAMYSVWLWMQSSFGPLLPSEMMRIIIPAFTLLIAGMQTIFASFFVNMISVSKY